MDNVECRCANRCVNLGRPLGFERKLASVKVGIMAGFNAWRGRNVRAADHIRGGIALVEFIEQENGASSFEAVPVVKVVGQLQCRPFGINIVVPNHIR